MIEYVKIAFGCYRRGKDKHIKNLINKHIVSSLEWKEGISLACKVTSTSDLLRSLWPSLLKQQCM